VSGPFEDRPITTVAFPRGIQVFERGWLSSNCVLFEDEHGATLIDSGYFSHADQTVALVAHALERHATPRLRRVINTHLHSDHCGGNAALARRLRCEVVIPEGNSYGVRHWDQRFLTFTATGQHCDRFDFTDTVSAGDVLTMGGQEWEALAAPGHDVDSLMFHCEEEGILISGDALWEDGCGAMFPTANPKTLDEDFAAAFETLELVESIDARVVVPGHGRPFTDVDGALDRCRSRLRHLSVDPAKNGRHVAKVLLKYRLLDDRRMSIDTIRTMFREVPAIAHANRDIGLPSRMLADRTIDDLVRVGVARREGDWLIDI
jgi:glyoxylase-like metal-dependent hydrolase (beta-lactamase superfamily II)